MRNNFIIVLVAFAKLRKATIRFVILVRLFVCLPVCISVRMEQLSSY
jgi:hypothetical protein